jgi:SNF2 family DNA or RNA helicase
LKNRATPARLAQLRARITPFMLRRTKALVALSCRPRSKP